ncbi:PLD nuclease N-terminal domain-containing protein [Actinacidiphila sp. DG2A-62]|uniref:PLD nuclease N-terminal domain-containing protein n=1 Tax=Actinacidiphila sp. DG2A-62 TaxID=3108821 RepID=UPI002DB9EC5D|nr:PLD nuclease N-terminal domain-containing protein [Actinacidiphila sp. DG2A-62]MEC3996276.1 PLD nuclease N-terminal domain-containing protein [Actinacidiphila sp. DG2A-62]
MLRYAPYLVILALWIYAFADCIGTPERQVRFLPKLAWLMIIVFFGWIVVGPLAWLIAGRHRYVAAPPVTVRAVRGPAEDEGAGNGRAERPGGRTAAWQPPPRGWVAPDDNPEFLRSLGELNRRNRGDRGDLGDGD